MRVGAMSVASGAVADRRVAADALGSSVGLMALDADVLSLL